MRAVLRTLGSVLIVVGFVYGAYWAVAAFFGTELCAGVGNCRWVFDGWPWYQWGAIFLVYLTVTPLVSALYAAPPYLVAALLLWAGAERGGSPGSPSLMPYRGRLMCLWQTLMATWGKLVVSLVDLALLVIAVSVGWRAYGVLGAIGALLFMGMVGGILRGVVMVVTGFIVSLGFGIPVAAFLATWVKVPEGEVAPALE